MVFIAAHCAESTKPGAAKEASSLKPMSARGDTLKIMSPGGDTPLQPMKGKSEVSKSSPPKKSAPPPLIVVTIDKRAAGTDAMSVVVDKRGTSIFIDHNFGIGSGSVTLSKGAWSPVTRIVMRGFGMLEHIELEHGSVKLTSSLGNAPDVDVSGGGDTLASLQMPIKVSGKDIVVEVPRAFLDAQTKSLKLRWIDAYR